MRQKKEMECMAAVLTLVSQKAPMACWVSELSIGWATAPLTALHFQNADLDERVMG